MLTTYFLFTILQIISFFILKQLNMNLPCFLIFLSHKNNYNINKEHINFLFFSESILLLLPHILTLLVLLLLNVLIVNSFYSFFLLSSSILLSVFKDSGIFIYEKQALGRLFALKSILLFSFYYLAFHLFLFLFYSFVSSSIVLTHFPIVLLHLLRLLEGV